MESQVNSDAWPPTEPGFYVVIGRDRNEFIESILRNDINFQSVSFTAVNNTDDLMDNARKFYQQITYLYNCGFRKFCVKNIEVGMPVLHLVKLEEILTTQFPDAIIVVTTESHVIARAERLLYVNSDDERNEDQLNIAYNRIRYGNVLDAIDTGLLHQKPKYAK